MFSKIGLFIASFSLLLTTEVNAQNFTYGTVSVDRATFSGGNLPIRRDEGAAFYGTPHWDVDAAEQMPVAYKSGVAPRVAVYFKLECENAPDSITVRGMARRVQFYVA